MMMTTVEKIECMELDSMKVYQHDHMTRCVHVNMWNAECAKFVVFGLSWTQTSHVIRNECGLIASRQVEFSWDRAEGSDLRPSLLQSSQCPV